MKENSNINRRGFLKLAGLGAACALGGRYLGQATGDHSAEAAETSASTTAKPNVIVILADDVGYGDVGCYGATKIKTPNIDKLAAQGVRFTDAHASAATCTPTRYSLLTGHYAATERAAERNKGILDEIMHNWEAPQNNLAGIERSAWAAYNSVSEYVDHGRTTRGTTPRERDENRAHSVLFGSGNQIKQAAFTSALELLN